MLVPKILRIGSCMCGDIALAQVQNHLLSLVLLLACLRTEGTYMQAGNYMAHDLYLW